MCRSADPREHLRGDGVQSYKDTLVLCVLLQAHPRLPVKWLPGWTEIESRTIVDSVKVECSPQEDKYSPTGTALFYKPLPGEVGVGVGQWPRFYDYAHCRKTFLGKRPPFLIFLSGNGSTFQVVWETCPITKV